VSLQIQNLCDAGRIKVEEDLMDELARLPRSLAGMYSLILDSISQIEKHGRTIAETMLRWLLCTEDATSKTTIAACSGTSLTGRENLSIEDVLNLCCNLVVYDESVDTFRFAHLSVREYLESQPGYTLLEANICLLERFLPTCIRYQYDSEDPFCRYAACYWVSHYCRLEEKHRRKVFELHAKRFLFNGAQSSEAYDTWATEGPFVRLCWPWNPSNRPFSIQMIHDRIGSAIGIVSYMTSPESIPSPVDLACCFGWVEVLDHYEKNQNLDAFRGSTTELMNLAISYGQISVVRWLLSRDVLPMDGQLKLAFTHGREDIIQSFSDLDILSVNTLVDGEQPLILAVRHALVAVAQHLIEKGAAVDCQDRIGRTPLFDAALSGYLTQLVECLLQAGANVNHQDQTGRTPLFDAVSKQCSTQLVERLLSAGANVNHQDQTGRTPLFDAVSKHRSTQLVERLLQAGANVNHQDQTGRTPLFDAVSTYQSTQLVECLLQAGANVNCRDHYRLSPLLLALLNGCPSPLIECLLQAGADPAAQENAGEVPLALLISRREQLIFEMLLERGFSADLKFTGREDLLRLALHLCCYHTACLLLSYGVDSLLEEENTRAEWMTMLTSVVILHGQHDEASVPAAMGPKKVLSLLFGRILPEDSVSQTLLSLAAQLRHEEAFRLLLDMGIDPTCPAICDTTLEKSSTVALIRDSMSRHESSVNNGNGKKMVDELRQGPLAWAALIGNLPLAESILDRGLDPNLKNRNGQTALYFTVQCVEDRHSRKNIETDKEAIFRLLLRRGALLTPQSGSILLAYALQAGYRRLAKLLLGAGAERPSGATSMDGVMEPLWGAFDQGEEGIRHALLARMGGGARSDSLTDQEPSSEDPWCFGDPLDIAARLMCRGAMRVLGDAVLTAPDDSQGQ
jgi:ankyrin repeat protein